MSYFPTAHHICNLIATVCFLGFLFGTLPQQHESQAVGGATGRSTPNVTQRRCCRASVVSGLDVDPEDEELGTELSSTAESGAWLKELMEPPEPWAGEGA